MLVKVENVKVLNRVLVSSFGTSLSGIGRNVLFFFFSDTTTLPGVRTSVKREERSIDTKEGEDGGVLYLSRDSQLLQGSRVRVGQWGLKV